MDFSRLITPARHGDVLVEPAASQLVELLHANRRASAQLDVRIGGLPLAEIRSSARSELGLGDEPLVLTGHQPDFIHAGVWAKHIVAMRLADAAGGSAVNLVVDHDAPRAFALVVPQIEPANFRRLTLRYADWPSGAALEGIPTSTPATVDALSAATAAALGPLFEESQLPAYWRAYRQAAHLDDWVEQAVHARRATEQSLGVTIADRRVSRCWSGPLLCALLGDAPRFAGEYNRALAAYRLRLGLTNIARPMPDLFVHGDRCETALWIYRLGEPRRRLFVERRGVRLALFAGEQSVVEWAAADVLDWSQLASLLPQLSDWVIRPRALTLTLWARLVLGDLFVHGIGGAKYDRITDDLLARYFGVEPPHMACVSATLRLRLAGADRPAADLQREFEAARRAARDLHFNPQRHGSAGAIAELAAQKRSRIAESARLRRLDPADRIGRRAIFQQIRALNADMRVRLPSAARAAAEHTQACAAAQQNHAVAADREYFFAMHHRVDLERLLENLPRVTHLRPATIV